MIRHTGIDVVRDAGLFGCIGTCFAYGNFIAPVRSVDKGNLGTGKQPVEYSRSSWTSQIAFDDFDIG